MTQRLFSNGEDGCFVTGLRIDDATWPQADLCQGGGEQIAAAQTPHHRTVAGRQRHADEQHARRCRRVAFVRPNFVRPRAEPAIR